MKKIDLHTHSWYSDGGVSPSELVREASEQGLDILALTDHDGTFGIDEAVKAGRQYGVQVIGGVEFSSYLETFDCHMHILGLGIDWNEPSMQEKMIWIREKRKERNARMLDIFHQLGFDLTMEDMQVYPGQDYVGKPNMARALVNRGYASSVREVFESEKMLKAPQMKVVRRDRVPAEEAIRLIHNAGGLAVLAHPYKVFWKDRVSPSHRDFDDPVHQDYRQKLELILDKLVGRGLDGMECFYSSHSRRETEYLCNLARERGLMITAGSDYHGAQMREGVSLAGCWKGWEMEVVPDAVKAVETAAIAALAGTRRGRGLPEDSK